jgi:heme/copper-type cytochrome/quinol oxidase subunit 3
MTTIDHKHGQVEDASKPLWARYRPGHHWKNAAEEFDGCKLGFWLFLATEVLLFAGIFVAYAIFRAKYRSTASKRTRSRRVSRCCWRPL